MRKLVTTHSVEIHSPADVVPGAPSRTPYELLRSEVVLPELNRFLYNAVGTEWCWYARRTWTYAKWFEFLDRPEVGTWVAYVRGTPAGYFELEMQAEESVEIAYFGLLPPFIGQGMGGALLSDAVATAWEFGAKRIWLHTCSMDHPSALANYQARGFKIFETVDDYEEIPDKPLQPWSNAYPEVSATE